MKELKRESLVKTAKEIKMLWNVNQSQILDEIEELQRIAKVGNTNWFMCQKRWIMHDIVRSIPLTPSACPFCEEFYYGDSDNRCLNCPYGKRYGCCLEGGKQIRSKKKLPSYKKIVRARNKLQAAIQGYWED